MTVAQERSLSTNYPELVFEWDANKNTAPMDDYTYASNKKAWWLCNNCGFGWEAIIANRSLRGTGCPVCSGQKLKFGVNDLTHVNPSIAEEWHPTKNGMLSPDDITAGSPVSVWWICTNDHEWKARVRDRTKGGGCRECHNLKLRTNAISILKERRALANEWDYERNGLLLPENVARYSWREIHWICTSNSDHKWVASPANRIRRDSGCPHCFRAGRIGAENEVVDFLTSIGVQGIERHNTTILDGKEIDIYIPSLNIGIEYNGLYWHSDAFPNSKDRHHAKYRIASKKGVQLIQIWEDDWLDRNSIVKRTLVYKLGLYTSEERYLARKLVFSEIDTATARLFMNDNHIQGFAKATHQFALSQGDDVVAVLSLEKTSLAGSYLISRYATQGQVVGGFTKMLRNIERTIDIDKFVTFADNSISDGSLYESTGFIVDGLVSPDYMYIKSKKRFHKFGFRINRFKSDDKLAYLDGMTEYQLAKLNGFNRIWDSGKVRYALHINKENKTR